MVRQDILGGLRVALSKGESLQSAMQSFYNAGYKKEDIEEAAQTLYTETPETQQASSIAQSSAIQKPVTQIIKPTPPSTIQTQKQISQPTSQKISNQQPFVPSTHIEQVSQIQPPQSRQIVSSYEAPKQKKKIDWVTIILVLILVCLLGVLVGVFFYKQQLVDFLTKYLS